MLDNSWSAKSERHEREVVTITLKVEPDGAIVVRSTELIGAGSRARFSFPPQAAIEASFQPAAAERVRELVARVFVKEGMISLPDHVLRVPGLMLGECNVVAADVVDGGQQVLIRFRRFFGDLFSLFAEDYMPRRKLADASSEHAINLVEQAYLPLVAFIDHVQELRDNGEISSAEKSGEALFAITERIRSLEVCRILAKEAISTAQMRRATMMRGDSATA